MAPGSAAIPICGKETIRGVFGGAALHMHVIGDPVPGGAEFTYELTAPDRLRWSGTLQGHPVHLSFARRPEREYLLVERGFHWINEVPFNR